MATVFPLQRPESLGQSCNAILCLALNSFKREQQMENITGIILL